MKLKNSKHSYSSDTYKNPSAIMVVGTASGVGKSLIATGLCKLLSKKYKVAPFKGQNMSNNAAVTLDGLEMGRSQYVQAQAAGVEPHVDMNPILLKPSGKGGCQVVVCGKVLTHQSTQEYYQEERYILLKSEAEKAYSRLSTKYDVIILEGAGSPAEINLRERDFTNMDMAEYAQASVILVADIERGGVFASIYGTVKLLPLHQRRLIQGIVINKFYGDTSLLQTGIEEIEKGLQIPVLGVLPWQEQWNLEEEDSLTIASTGSTEYQIDTEKLDLVVVLLPHISNYTDFQVFEGEPGVQLRYVTKPNRLGNPDLIWIPGSKNVIEDLSFLKHPQKDRNKGISGSWESVLCAAYQRKIPIMGICGGYQMLGQTIEDPHFVESEVQGQNKAPVIQGLGLLSIKSTLYPQKEIRQVHGVTKNFPFINPNQPFQGYEIHCGKTEYIGTEFLEKYSILEFQSSGDGTLDNSIDQIYEGVQKEGLVWGCYIHGFFDEERLRKDFLNQLWKRRGDLSSPITPLAGSKYNSEKTVEAIAAALEKHVDVKTIESWINTGESS
jgi:adenosylcobyric acid synthase